MCKKCNQKDFDLNNFTMGQIRESVEEFKTATPLGKVIDIFGNDLIAGKRTLLSEYYK